MAKYDTEKFINHLKGKWGNNSCPVCKESSWQIQDSTFMLMEFNDNNLILGGPVIPVIPVTCKNCGNTILVNALVSGIIKTEEQKNG